MPSIGLCAQLACIWEASARKPGNVHRLCDFDDVHYLDFLASAAAIAPVLELAQQNPIGQTVVDAVRATRQVVLSNTNLGILLLLVPLATAKDYDKGIHEVLQELTIDDARAVYEAIRLAQPGGMGQVPEQDVRSPPTRTLRELMALAADRDLVARQYVNGFQQILEEGAPGLLRRLRGADSLETAIIGCHVELMAAYPDSLILRKRGPEEAKEASRRARRVLDAGWPETIAGRRALDDLDAWLRALEHARNPGTTADLVTASLFVLLRQGNIDLPLRYPWQSVPEKGSAPLPEARAISQKNEQGV
jgi:triphosphoribosyl-dephospho-CoA synthase